MQTLREARKKKGIKACAVADAIGVSRQTYAKYEDDQGIMSIKHAQAACDFMGLDFDSIFFAGRR